MGTVKQSGSRDRFAATVDFAALAEAVGCSPQTVIRILQPSFERGALGGGL